MVVIIIRLHRLVVSGFWFSVFGVFDGHSLGR